MDYYTGESHLLYRKHFLIGQYKDGTIEERFRVEKKEDVIEIEFIIRDPNSDSVQSKDEAVGIDEFLEFNNTEDDEFWQQL